MGAIWDSHVHLFTEDMSKQPEAWADAHHETVWKACVAPPDRPSIQGWSTVDQMLANMDDAGVECVVLQGWYWENQETCRLHNRFYEKLIRQYSDRILAFATVQPTSGDSALEEIRWAHQHGFSGIGEIHPQAQGFSLGDSCWQAIMEQIQEWNFPINLHVTETRSKPFPGKIETPLDDYLELAVNWPDQILILAHLGGQIPLLPQSNSLHNQLNRVYYDCAAIPLLYEASILPQIADEVGADHLLFGSDYPLRSFPRNQKVPDFTRSIQFVEESGLTEDQLTRVLSTNARELFRV